MKTQIQYLRKLILLKTNTKKGFLEIWPTEKYELKSMSMYCTHT